jgi:hypothetical protein
MPEGTDNWGVRTFRVGEVGSGVMNTSNDFTVDEASSKYSAINLQKYTFSMQETPNTYSRPNKFTGTDSRPGGRVKSSTNRRKLLDALVHSEITVVHKKI